MVEEELNPVGRLVDGEDDGAAGAGDVVDLLDDAVGAGRVQAGGGLVEEEQCGTVDYVDADRHPATFPAGDPSSSFITYVSVPGWLHHHASIKSDTNNY